MADKRELEITAKVKDQATAPLRKIAKVFSVTFGKPIKIVAALARQVFSLKTALVGFVGVLAAGQAVTWITELARDLDFISKQSDRLGVTTRSLQELQFLAGRAELDFRSLAEGLDAFQSNLQAARDGSVGQADAFRALGISINNLPLGPGGKLNFTELLKQLAEGFRNSHDPIKRTANLMTALSEPGKLIGPILKDGAEGISKQVEEFERLEGVLSAVDLARASQFTRELANLQSAFRGLARAVFVEFAPGLTVALRKASDLISQNRGEAVNWAKTIATVVVRAVEALTDALIGLVGALEVIAKKFDDSTATAQEKALVKQLKLIEQSIDGYERLASSLRLVQIAAERNGRTFEDQLRLLNEMNKERGGFLVRGPVRIDVVAPHDSLQKGISDTIKVLEDARIRVENLIAKPIAEGLRNQKSAIVGEFKKLLDALDREAKDRKPEVAPTPSPTGVPIGLANETAEFARLQQRNALLQQFLDMQEATENTRKAIIKLRLEAKQLQFLQAFKAGVISADEFRVALEAAANEARRLNEEIRAGNGPVQDLIRSWSNFDQQIGNFAVQTLDSLADAITDAITQTKSWKEAFEELGRTVVRELTNIAIKYIIAAIAKSIFENFETGGVKQGQMGKPVPVRKYAYGGVADSPQLALFGEGSGAEAFVPLPDGKTIPVTLKGGGAGGPTIIFQNQFIDGRDANRFFIENRETLWALIQQGIQGGSRQLHMAARGKV